MITEYRDAKELVDIYEKYWIPYRFIELGQSESGVEINAVIDKKSEKLYIEQYNTILDKKTVHSFEVGSYPSTWMFEEDNPKVTSISLD